MQASTPPLVSVVMPCYNSEHHILSSIDSALSQTYENIELVIVDDGSTDGSFELLQRADDPRLRLISISRSGVSIARNTAISACKGDYVAFLDSDDTWDPTFIERMLAPLESNPDVALSYCGWQNLGLAGERAAPFVPVDHEHDGKLAAVFRGCPWPIHAALTRREAIEHAGKFDSRFYIGEDFLLWLRIASKNKICVVPEVLARYHHHTDARATTCHDEVAKETWRVQRAFLDECGDLAPPELRRLKKLANAVLKTRGFECYWRGDLKHARSIFRLVMWKVHGGAKDWLYMLPSVLPLSIHERLLLAATRIRKKIRLREHPLAAPSHRRKASL